MCHVTIVHVCECEIVIVGGCKGWIAQVFGKGEGGGEVSVSWLLEVPRSY